MVSGVRAALETFWNDTCTVTEYQEVEKANHATVHRDVVVLEGVPCKLSFSTLKTTDQSEIGAKLVQSAKLILAPEIKIKPGSKITVQRGDHTFVYQSSGKPGIFSNHQEIMLETFKGWA